MRISDWSSDVCSSDLLKRTMQQGLVNFINDKVMPVIDRFAKWMKDNPQIVGPVISALKTLAIVFGSLAVGGAIIAGVAAAFSLVSGPVLAVVEIGRAHA